MTLHVAKAGFVQTAYLNAIATAKRLVYIENQFFQSSGHLWLRRRDSVSNLVAQALLDKLLHKIEHGEDFHVMIVVPLYPLHSQLDFARLLMNYQFRTVEMLFQRVGYAVRQRFGRRRQVADYLGVYCLGKVTAAGRRGAIYVHSKLLLVDDEYVLLGSANINERSLRGDGGGDSELMVGAWEATRPSGAVGAFRRQLWREHLGDAVWAGLYNASLPQQLRTLARHAGRNWNAYRALQPTRGHLMRYPAYFDLEQHRLVPESIPKPPHHSVLANGKSMKDSVSLYVRAAENTISLCE